MKEDILRYIRTCPVCHVSYMPKAGEVCDCPVDDLDTPDEAWNDPTNPLAEAHKQ